MSMRQSMGGDSPQPAAMVGCGGYESEEYVLPLGNYSPTLLTEYIRRLPRDADFAKGVVNKFKGLKKGDRVTFDELAVMQEATKTAGHESHAFTSMGGDMAVNNKSYAPGGLLTVYGKRVSLSKDQSYPDGVLTLL